MIIKFIAIVLMLGGAGGVLYAAAQANRTQSQIDFIRSLGRDAESLAEPIRKPERIEAPIVTRLFGPVADLLRHALARLYPSRDIDRIHTDLLKAGLTGTVRAEEFVALQVAGVIMGVATGLVTLATGLGGVRTGVALLILLPLGAAVGPSIWLRRRIENRRTEVSNELPDVLDLMTISVSAGLGLEQAMQVSCAHFESAVSTELRLTLREMELGLSRHDALENLKLRTDIDDLVTFAVVLSQADALGLPIGRVLEAQADEMRDKRRQRARERAAKVPVKILFPLAFCFLPAILIIVLGPLAGPISHIFH